jgi:hypothetical protein
MAGGDGCVLLQPTSLDSGGVNSCDTDLDLHITLFARNALNSRRLQGRTCQITAIRIFLEYTVHTLCISYPWGYVHNDYLQCYEDSEVK